MEKVGDGHGNDCMLHWKATYNTFATQTPGPYDLLAAGTGSPKAFVVATHVLSIAHLNKASIRLKCTLTLNICSGIRNVPTHVDGCGFCGFCGFYNVCG